MRGITAFLLGLVLCSVAALAQMPMPTTNFVKGTAVAYQGALDIKGSAGFYGGLRCASAADAAAGNVNIIQIVRASDSTTSDIKCLSNGTGDSASAITFCASTTCKIVTVYDRSGNANNATQGTDNFRPALVFSGCPASAAMCGKFDSAGQEKLPTGNVTQAQPFTISTVVERYALFTTQMSIADFGVAVYELQFTPSANQVAYYAGTARTATANDSALHAIQNVINNAGTSDIYIDGSRPTTTTPGTGAPSAVPFKIGGDDAGNNPSMYWFETGWWPVAFSNSDEVNMNGNQHGTNGWNF